MTKLSELKQGTSFMYPSGKKAYFVSKRTESTLYFYKHIGRMVDYSRELSIDLLINDKEVIILR